MLKKTFIIYLAITDFSYKNLCIYLWKKTVTKNFNKLNVHNIHSMCLKYNMLSIVRLLYSKTIL